MWIRIRVFVAFPPTPPYRTPCLLPACRAFRMSFGRTLPFQSVRLSSPISRIFCAPMDGPLLIACEPPMLLTSRTTKYEKPLTARTRAAATQLRAYPALPAAPHNGVGEPGLTMAPFLSSPSSGSLPSDEAYRRVPVTRPQRLTSEAPMSDPRWRETRPNRPNGGEPGARPRGRVPGPPPAPGRVPGRPPGAVPPRIPPRASTAGGRGPAAAGGHDSRVVPPGAGRAPRREGDRGVPDPRDPGPGGGGPNGRGATGRAAADGPPTRQMPAQPGEPQPARTRQPTGPREVHGRNPRRSRGAGRWGALQGGLGVCIIVASAALGTIATMVTRSAPGFLLGLFVEAGTVVAALAVRPRAGRMIFPVPVLSYLVGALISGFVFNRSGTSKTALAIGAAQWVANGFFAMALATVLAVAIVAVRWYLWRRSRRPARPVRRSRMDWEARDSWDDADPRGGARRPGPRPGTGPYNFSRGA